LRPRAPRFRKILNEVPGSAVWILDRRKEFVYHSEVHICFSKKLKKRKEKKRFWQFARIWN
jgi:hypothetical protein